MVPDTLDKFKESYYLYYIHWKDGRPVNMGTPVCSIYTSLI